MARALSSSAKTTPRYPVLLRRRRSLSQLNSWRQRTNDLLIDPAKLARLTVEQDEQAKKYKKGSRSDSWEYHQYLYGD
jgi:hypothetical protein